MANIYLDICLSDIPKERIKQASNGKKYLKCIVRPRKDTDRDGYDHYIAVSVPRDEQLDRPLFIGRAQVRMDGQAKNGAYSGAPMKDNAQSIDPDNDLPF